MTFVFNLLLLVLRKLFYLLLIYIFSLFVGIFLLITEKVLAMNLIYKIF
ncbi:hypothetical protein SK110_0954 [Lactococcus cremoris]|nr:hypothetical protein SK110_0954 [Lactococcus cremoris]